MPKSSFLDNLSVSDEDDEDTHSMEDSTCTLEWNYLRKTKYGRKPKQNRKYVS